MSSDGRGKHVNRPHKISGDTEKAVKLFISSLKGRKSHYSLSDSDKVYLSEELNIHKLSCLFNASNPTHEVSYDKFREIFNNNFNIAFGYPRKDTCSFCDL